MINGQKGGSEGTVNLYIRMETFIQEGCNGSLAYTV